MAPKKGGRARKKGPAPTRGDGTPRTAPRVAPRAAPAPAPIPAPPVLQPRRPAWRRGTRANPTGPFLQLGQDGHPPSRAFWALGLHAVPAPRAYLRMPRQIFDSDTSESDRESNSSSEESEVEEVEEETEQGFEEEAEHEAEKDNSSRLSSPGVSSRERTSHSVPNTSDDESGAGSDTSLPLLPVKRAPNSSSEEDSEDESDDDERAEAEAEADVEEQAEALLDLWLTRPVDHDSAAEDDDEERAEAEAEADVEEQAEALLDSWLTRPMDYDSAAEDDDDLELRPIKEEPDSEEESAEEDSDDEESRPVKEAPVKGGDDEGGDSVASSSMRDPESQAGDDNAHLSDVGSSESESPQPMGRRGGLVNSPLSTIPEGEDSVGRLSQDPEDEIDEDVSASDGSPSRPLVTWHDEIPGPMVLVPPSRDDGFPIDLGVSTGSDRASDDSGDKSDDSSHSFPPSAPTFARSLHNASEVPAGNRRKFVHPFAGRKRRRDGDDVDRAQKRQKADRAVAGRKRQNDEDEDENEDDEGGHPSKKRKAGGAAARRKRQNGESNHASKKRKFDQAATGKKRQGGRGDAEHVAKK